MANRSYDDTLTPLIPMLDSTKEYEESFVTESLKMLEKDEKIQMDFSRVTTDAYTPHSKTHRTHCLIYERLPHRHEELDKISYDDPRNTLRLEGGNEANYQNPFSDAPRR